MDIVAIAATGIGAGLTAVVAAVGAYVTMRRPRHQSASVQEERDPTASKPISETSFRRYAFVDAARGTRIGYVTGRIINVKGIDVWVNGENTKMEMARPSEFSVSAIIRGFGQQRDSSGKLRDTVYDELRAAVGQATEVAPGSAFVTSGGQLAVSNGVSHVIHVAAVQVQGQIGTGYRQIDDVGTCVQNALAVMDQLAEEHKVVCDGDRHPSVLIPLLGTGVGRANVATTVRDLVDAAIAYVEDTGDTAIQEIFFLAYAERDRASLVRYLDSLARLAEVVSES
jgi:Macro domain